MLYMLKSSMHHVSVLSYRSSKVCGLLLMLMSGPHVIFFLLPLASSINLLVNGPWHDTEGCPSNCTSVRDGRRRMISLSISPAKLVKEPRAERKPLKISWEGSQSMNTLSFLNVAMSSSANRSVTRHDFGGLFHPGPRRSSNEIKALR